MEIEEVDPRLRLIQQAQMKDKAILIRVDHNVVKKGQIQDPYRIDATVGTLYAIALGGGKPILMSHVGRPRDKKTGIITCQEDQSVAPIVRYLEQKLPLKIHVPEFTVSPDRGILHMGDSVKRSLGDLRARKIDMIYLPNTRWFQGEQSGGTEREVFANELSALADLYVNDAFGSWQAHVSTYDIAKKLPSYAGLLLQREIANLHKVFNPQRPFVAIIAGAKYDTKIGPVKALYRKVDFLILGGLIYNTFLSAKYGVQIGGVSEEDRRLATELVEMDQERRKILEMPYLVESETPEQRIEGKCKVIGVEKMNRGKKFGYFLDVAPQSLEDPRVTDILSSAKTVFVNAVMGLMPSFFEGSQVLYRLVASNRNALKLFGGGDTLQGLRNLCPGIYMSGLDDPATYYFTGGGSVLAAIEQGSPYHLKPIAALMQAG